MIVPLRYAGASGVVQRLRAAHVGLATNTLRETVFFRGRLGRPLVVRDALSALHGVVASDLKYRPRERVGYRAWLAEQDRRFLETLALRSDEARRRLDELQARRAELDARRARRLAPFDRARRAYLRYACQNEYELAWLMDPVITVHPDEVFFEAFSRDESSYARVGVSHDAFASLEEFECGTTNIDFSRQLAAGLDRIRSYRETRFEIAPGGLEVTTAGDSHREKKIDLPESWVQGFLQVHSTMAMGLTHVRMTPVELYNLCRHLGRRKARQSPRALRFELEPGRGGRLVLEPWEHAIELSRPFEGPRPVTVRCWGRRRLLLLERLIPIARSVDVYLAGFGLPSVYVLDLGDASFTLALSGWTDNDWSGGAKFDLLTRRLSGTAEDLLAAYQALRERRAATDRQLSESTGLGREKTRSALSHLCQVGRAIFDLRNGVYRHRDLFLEPFTAKEAARAVSPAASEASVPASSGREIYETDNVRIIARRPVSTGFKVSGSAKGRDGKRVRPLVALDHQGQIVEAECTCRFSRKHALTRGPCEHVLALRLAHMQRLEAEDRKGGAGE